MSPAARLEVEHVIQRDFNARVWITKGGHARKVTPEVAEALVRDKGWKLGL